MCRVRYSGVRQSLASHAKSVRTKKEALPEGRNGFDGEATFRCTDIVGSLLTASGDGWMICALCSSFSDLFSSLHVF